MPIRKFDSREVPPGMRFETLREAIKKCYGNDRKGLVGVYKNKEIIREGKIIKFLEHQGLKKEYMFETYVMSRYFGMGPKMMVLTPHQMESMIHTKCRFPIGEYEQPFETIAIEFPKRLDGTRYHGILGGIVTRDKDGVAFVLYGTETNSGGLFQIDKDETATMEQGLTELSSVYTDAYSTMIKDCCRVLFNVCQLMVMMGVQNKGRTKEDSAAWDRISKAKNPPKSVYEQLSEDYQASPQILAFKQHIVLHTSKKVADVTSGEGKGGWTVKPHWRSGFIMMQAHGPNHTERKKRFQPAVFVNEHLFIGDHSDTEVTMEIKR